ncbi:hypothetical protein COXBURSA331_A0506 [Coxiella burnetii RSA 331]|nr:hypothetical protein COXBURSA331_A0506 [Coxiella burnetii RSA 331]
MRLGYACAGMTCKDINFLELPSLLIKIIVCEVKIQSSPMTRAR